MEEPSPPWRHRGFLEVNGSLVFRVHNTTEDIDSICGRHRDANCVLTTVVDDSSDDASDDDGI